jgi:hypothetical protein
MKTKDVSAVLNFLGKKNNKSYTIDALFGEASLQDIELQLALNDLLWYDLIQTRYDDNDVMCYIITPLGIKVAAKDGYAEVLNTYESKKDFEKTISLLEIKKLKHEVAFQKIQFWIFIIGSISGLISFIILLYQFITGKGNFH